MLPQWANFLSRATGSNPGNGIDHHLIHNELKYGCYFTYTSATSLFSSRFSDGPEDRLESGSVLLQTSRFRLCFVLISFSGDKERLSLKISSSSDDKERLRLVSSSFTDDKERRAFKGESVKNYSILI